MGNPEPQNDRFGPNPHLVEAQKKWGNGKAAVNTTPPPAPTLKEIAARAGTDLKKWWNELPPLHRPMFGMVGVVCLATAATALTVLDDFTPTGAREHTVEKILDPKAEAFDTTCATMSNAEISNHDSGPLHTLVINRETIATNYGCTDNSRWYCHEGGSSWLSTDIDCSTPPTIARNY